MKYYIEKVLNTDFDTAVTRVKEALQSEGFGVLTEINTNEVLKAKLNVDFRRYKILGACNPSFAYQALQKEDKIGTMLPCNVVLQELKEGQTEVFAVDPIASMQAVENKELTTIAASIKMKLEAVIGKL